MKALDFLNCDQLCERWGIDYNQLRQIIYEANLPFYDIASNYTKPVPVNQTSRENVLNPMPFDVWKGDMGFKMSDIITIEESTPGLLNELSGKDGRELGRLKREVGKMDEALKAAVLAGLTAAKGHLKKADLWTALETARVEITEATFRKIWKMIPEKHRRRAGRPKKNMIN